MDEMLSVLRSSWSNFLELLRRFLPQVLAMLLIVVAGWVIATIAKFIVGRLVRLLKINALLERAGTTELLRKMNAPAIDRIAGRLVFWIVWLAFLFSGMHALGFTGTELLAADLVRLVPKLGVAIVIVVAGVALSNFLWRAALLAAVKARLRSASLIGGLVRVLALVATAAMAFEQLGIAQQVVQSVFVMAFGAVMLAAGLAFGLGGRGLARRVLEEKLAPKSYDGEEPPHV